MKDIKLTSKMKFKKLITRFTAGATAFSMSALVLAINSKAASQEPDVKISCNSYRFLLEKLSLDENNTFTRRLNDEKVLSFFDNSRSCENCSASGSEHEKCDGGGATAMPSYLFETTDIPMFSVTQGGKEMKFSEVSVTQNDAPKNTFNVKVKEIDKQKNLFSVEIETKSSKPVTVTESNVPIGYQPLNPSVTIHTYDIVGKTITNAYYPLKVAFTKSFVGDNGGFMQAVERAQSGEQTLTKLLQNLFISNPLFVLKKRQKGSGGDYVNEVLSNSNVEIAAYSTSPVDNKTGFTAIITVSPNVETDINTEFTISETDLLSEFYTSSGDAYFVSPMCYDDYGGPKEIEGIIKCEASALVKLPFESNTGANESSPLPTLEKLFERGVYVLLPAGTVLYEKGTFEAEKAPLEVAKYIYVK